MVHVELLLLLFLSTLMLLLLLLPMTHCRLNLSMLRPRVAVTGQQANAANVAQQQQQCGAGRQNAAAVGQLTVNSATVYAPSLLVALTPM
jgi:hypothetical protein